MRKSRAIIIGAICSLFGAGAIISIAQLSDKSRFLDTLSSTSRLFGNSLRGMTKFHEVSTINGKVVCEIWADGNRISIQSFENGKVVDLVRSDGKHTYWYSHQGEEEFALTDDAPARPSGESSALMNPNHPLGMVSFGRYPNWRTVSIDALAEPAGLSNIDFSRMRIATKGNDTIFQNPLPTSAPRNGSTYTLTFDSSSHFLKSVIVNRPNQAVKMSFDNPPRFDDKLFQPDPSKSRFLFRPQGDEPKIVAALRSPAKTVSRAGVKVQIVGCFRLVGTRQLALIWREFESSSKLATAPIITRPLPPETVKVNASMRILYGPDPRSRALQKLRMADKVTGGYIMVAESPVGKTIDAKIPGIRKTAFASVKNLQGKTYTFYNHKIEFLDAKNIPVIQVSSLDALVKRSLVKPRY